MPTRIGKKCILSLFTEVTFLTFEFENDLLNSHYPLYMKKIEISRFWYNMILAMIILISFIHFSEIYFPFPDLHTALTILITPGFSVPGDLYMWGQNFGGSLLPFLARLLYLIYRFPPAMAVSVVHFIILILGFLSLATLFRGRFFRILAALVWFIPPFHAISLVTSPFAIQLSIFLMGIYAIQRIKSASGQKDEILWLSLASLSFVIAGWVSDLSFLTIVVFLLYLLWQKYKSGTLKNPFISLKNKKQLYPLLIVTFFTFFGVLFILYGKSVAAKTYSIYSPLFNSGKDLFFTLNVFFLSLFKLITFSSGNITESLFIWGILFTIPYFLFKSRIRSNSAPIQPFPHIHYFFFCYALILLILLFLSHWILVNGADRRYFSPVFISVAVGLFLYLESADIPWPKTRKILLFMVFLSGSMSSILPQYFPYVHVSRNSELKIGRAHV